MQLSALLPTRSLVIPFPLRQSLPHSGLRPFVPSTPDTASETILCNAARMMSVTARSWWPAN